MTGITNNAVVAAVVGACVAGLIAWYMNPPTERQEQFLTDIKGLETIVEELMKQKTESASKSEISPNGDEQKTIDGLSKIISVSRKINQISGDDAVKNAEMLKSILDEESFNIETAFRVWSETAPLKNKDECQQTVGPHATTLQDIADGKTKINTDNTSNFDNAISRFVNNLNKNCGL